MLPDLGMKVWMTAADLSLANTARRFGELRTLIDVMRACQVGNSIRPLGCVLQSSSKLPQAPCSVWKKNRRDGNEFC